MTELKPVKIIDWVRNEWMFKIHMMVYDVSSGPDLPVEGFFEIHEPESGQREATIWQRLRADGSVASKPDEGVKLLVCRPAHKGDTEAEWQAHLIDVRAEMAVTRGRVRDNWEAEQAKTQEQKA